MKCLIFLSFIVFFLSCDTSSVDVNETHLYLGNAGKIKEFTYEGCEYFYKTSGYTFGITHKGNCINPIHKCK